MELEEALYLGEALPSVVEGLDPVAFLDVLDIFVRAVSHRDSASTSEAASATTSVVLIIVIVVVVLRKLCCSLWNRNFLRLNQCC